MSTIVNVKNLKGNKVYTMHLMEACLGLQKENEGFIIPKAQRGLSPKFEYKKVMLEGAFHDLNTFYIDKGLLYNLQVLTVLKTVKSQKQSTLGDGFQRLSTTTFSLLVNYREAIHAKNESLINDLEAALFRSSVMRDPGKTYIIQIENKQHSKYLNIALKNFFTVLDEEIKTNSYESISGKIKNNGTKFSSKFESLFNSDSPITENPYASTLLKTFKIFEVEGVLHKYVNKKTAKNIGGGEFAVEIELFNYLSHIEFTFSIPPEEVELNTLFERINTPATVLQQYDIVKNIIASESEEDENESEIDNILSEFETKIDLLTKSEELKPKLRLNFVEIALHSLRDKKEAGVVMTSTAGQVKDTVLYFFRLELKKENFSLLNFVKLMNSLAETELILKGKRYNNTVPDKVSSIAFLLNKTSKMRDRFSIPLLLLAKKVLEEDSNFSKKHVDKIVLFFSIYRVLRSEPIKGLNPEKGTESFFSDCAIKIANSKKEAYKDIWSLADKKDNLLCSADIFLKKIETWVFDFKKKNDKELLAVITWVFAFHFENISLTDKDILNYEIDHTIPLSHTNDKISMRQTGVSQNVKEYVIKEYFSKFFNFIFIHKKFNNHLTDISLESRNNAYKSHSPFLFQKELYGDISKDKISSTKDIDIINEKRFEIISNKLRESFFPINKN